MRALKFSGLNFHFLCRVNIKTIVKVKYKCGKMVETNVNYFVVTHFKPLVSVPPENTRKPVVSRRSSFQ